MACKSKLACPRVLRKIYPCSKVSPKTPKVEEDNVPVGHPPHPLQYAHQVCLSTNYRDSECHKQDSQKRLSEDNSHSSCLAQHVVVLGSSEPVIPAPLCLPYQPNLLTQLFNENLHRDLLNLNLHSCLSGSRPSESKVSLVKWQNELRLLRDAQQEQSMR